MRCSMDGRLNHSPPSPEVLARLSNPQVRGQGRWDCHLLERSASVEAGVESASLSVKEGIREEEPAQGTV